MAIAAAHPRLSTQRPPLRSLGTIAAGVALVGLAVFVVDVFGIFRGDDGANPSEVSTLAALDLPGRLNIELDEGRYDVVAEGTDLIDSFDTVDGMGYPATAVERAEFADPTMSITSAGHELVLLPMDAPLLVEGILVEGVPFDRVGIGTFRSEGGIVTITADPASGPAADAVVAGARVAGLAIVSHPDDSAGDGNDDIVAGTVLFVGGIFAIVIGTIALVVRADDVAVTRRR